LEPSGEIDQASSPDIADCWAPEASTSSASRSLQADPIETFLKVDDVWARANPRREGEPEVYQVTDVCRDDEGVTVTLRELPDTAKAKKGRGRPRIPISGSMEKR
jgi:hypothetical protein